MNYYYPSFSGSYYEKSNIFYPNQNEDKPNQLCSFFDETMKTIEVNKSRASLKINSEKEENPCSQHKKYRSKKTEKSVCYIQKQLQRKLCTSQTEDNKFTVNESLENEEIKLSR